MEQQLLQSRTLAALRDALLPKLISGEIRVKPGGKRSPEGPDLSDGSGKSDGR